ncbi:hypothetical protein [Nitrosomonas sp.]|uniref:hypothetical protein n=1 Tax=Nitrosomonas sp. TaxID=42353 RepID=UPI002730D578|nr:hypothetical protein [Nitrosomonas sp.]MDP1786631.1 hypothetical protein [Nitrosomonas sp.]
MAVNRIHHRYFPAPAPVPDELLGLTLDGLLELVPQGEVGLTKPGFLAVSDCIFCISEFMVAPIGVLVVSANAIEISIIKAAHIIIAVDNFFPES